jgi:hypothetical protein
LIEEILNPREVEESGGVGPDEAEMVKITIGNSLMMTEEDQRRKEKGDKRDSRALFESRIQW